MTCHSGSQLHCRCTVAGRYEGEGLGSVGARDCIVGYSLIVIVPFCGLFLGQHQTGHGKGQHLEKNQSIKHWLSCITNSVYRVALKWDSVGWHPLAELCFKLVPLLFWPGLNKNSGILAKGVGYLVKDPYLHIKNGNGIHNFGWPF